MTAGKTTEMKASELKDAHHVADCGFCGSTLVSASNSTAQFKDKHLYCPVCSETIAVADDAAAPDMTSDKDAGKTDDTDDLGDDATDSTDDLPEGEDESDDSEDDSDGSADDEEDADAESEDDAENDDTDTSSDSSNKDTKKTATAADDKSTDQTDDTDGSDDSDSEDDSSEDDSSEDDSEGDDSDSEDDTDDSKKDDTADVGSGKDSTLSASLLAAMSGKDTDISIVQSPDRTRWYLFANNSPVAISEAGRCQENLRSTFATNQFATAFTASTEEGVTEEILEEFGFEPVVMEIPVDEAVRQNVEAQIREKTEAHTMTAAAYGERFQQCFGMAAAGMPKRFFKGDRNPVEKALIASLQKVGVRDAANIVSNAFENHGKTLYKTLVLRANDLMDKEDKTLEELARLIDERESSNEVEVTKNAPIAALASMEEESVKTPVAVLASDSNDDDVFATFFQRGRR
jgi:hypothetical protein